ncbi:PAS domain S-box protein [Zhouia sp. PK063]|uniref:PAS domain S-box protein n=1 Tax=Zhouia sp. PK063 TaxID=3373602 RepID=UPI0037A6BED1
MNQLNFMNHAADAIICLALDGTITYANHAASQLFDHPLSELTAAHYSTLIPRELDGELDMIRDTILFNEDLEPFVSEKITGKGDRIITSAQYSPVKNDDGKISGISVVLRKVNQFQKVANKAQAFIEAAPDAIIVVNQLGQIVLVNAQTGKLFGYKKEELLGKDVEILIPDEFLSNHRKHRFNYQKNPAFRSMGQGLELFGKNRDGNRFPVEISLSPLKTEDGIFYSAAIRDITERKKAERKFRGLLESAPDAMVIAGRDGKIQLVNAQVENIFGYERDELIGQPVEILIPPRFHKNHPSRRNGFFSNIKARPMATALDLSAVKKNGEEFPAEISLSPLETEEGMLVSAAIRDTSERKAAEKALHAYNFELKNKNKELEQFAYIASHDLQEPLRTVISLVDLLNKQYYNTLDDAAKQYLTYITQASDRMSDLIKALLDYSRIGRDKQIRKVDCNLLVTEIQTDLSSFISENHAIFNIAPLPTIKGYRTELRLLFQNLIHNAIKFRNKEKAPVISITSRQVDDFWEFCIADNGIGINPEFKHKIFKIFQRLHPKNIYEGTGIGLAHCQKIVDLHGGRIWVESTPGMSSSFYFSIPITL